MDEFLGLILETQNPDNEKRSKAEELIKSYIKNSPTLFAGKLFEAINLNASNEKVLAIGLILISHNLNLFLDNKVLLFIFSLFTHNNQVIRNLSTHIYTEFSKILYATHHSSEPVQCVITNLENNTNIEYINSTFQFLTAFLISLPLSDPLSNNTTNFILTYFFSNIQSIDITIILLESISQIIPQIFSFLLDDQKFEHFMQIILSGLNIIELKSRIYKVFIKIIKFSYSKLSVIPQLFYQCSLSDLETTNDVNIVINVIDLWRIICFIETNEEFSNQLIYTYSTYLLIILSKFMNVENEEISEMSFSCLMDISSLIPQVTTRFFIESFNETIPPNVILKFLYLIFSTADFELYSEYFPNFIVIIHSSLSSNMNEFKFFALKCIKALVKNLKIEINFFEQFFNELKILWNDNNRKIAKLSFKIYNLIISKSNEILIKQTINEFYDNININNFHYISDFVYIMNCILINEICLKDINFSQQLLSKTFMLLKFFLENGNFEIINSLIYVLYNIFKSNNYKYSISNIINPLIEILMIIYKQSNFDIEIIPLIFSSISLFDEDSFSPFLVPITNLYLEIIRLQITEQFVIIILSSTCQICFNKYRNLINDIVINILQVVLNEKDLTYQTFSVVLDLFATFFTSNSAFPNDLLINVIKNIEIIVNAMLDIYNNYHSDCFTVLDSIMSFFIEIIDCNDINLINSLMNLFFGFLNAIMELNSYTKDIKLKILELFDKLIKVKPCK